MDIFWNYTMLCQSHDLLHKSTGEGTEEHTSCRFNLFIVDSLKCDEKDTGLRQKKRIKYHITVNIAQSKADQNTLFVSLNNIIKIIFNNRCVKIGFDISPWL